MDGAGFCYNIRTMFALKALIASALSPFFVDTSAEVRSTYVSLGKIIEDRPMQTTGVRAGLDAGDFGRFGFRNWDVSSLTGRRADAHRHALYHTEYGPAWQFDLDFAEGWRLKSDLTRSWTVYRGYKAGSSNRTYHWYQADESLENPYLVPFCLLRRTFRGNDYFYFKAGLRRRCPLWGGLALTPSAFAEGGNARCQRRTFGPNADGHGWRGGGASSISCRLELSWSFCEGGSVFAYVEQYDVIGGDHRRTNSASGSRCAHNDWTHGGVGLRFKF